MELATRTRHIDAVYKRDLGAIRQMLKSRAIPADEDAAVAGFRVALENGLVEVVELYLQAGLDLNQQDDSGFTPLTAAASAGRIEMVRRLLGAGCNVNVATHGGMTALHYAALRNDRDMLELLAQSGADVTCRNCEGSTALDLCRLRQFSIPSLRWYGTRRRIWTSASARFLRRLIARQEVAIK